VSDQETADGFVTDGLDVIVGGQQRGFEALWFPVGMTGWRLLRAGRSHDEGFVFGSEFGRLPGAGCIMDGFPDRGPLVIALPLLVHGIR